MGNYRDVMIVGAMPIAISLHSNLAELEDDWLSLQKDGLCTFFQTYEWSKSWQETAGESRRVDPSIICGRCNNGTLAFLFPFSVVTHMGSRVLHWYSSSEITYGMGIFDRQWLAKNPDLMEQLWPEILQTLGKIDAIRLDNQPDQWDGIDNPLKFLFTTRGANQSYRMILQENFHDLYEQKRSSSSRRSARKRDKKLLAAGETKFGLPDGETETYDLINTMINQQQDRLGERGIRTVYDETRRAFLHQLAKVKSTENQNVLLPYYLTIDGNICAVMLGGAFQSTYWALVSSLTGDTSLHALSPGDHALRATIEAVCKRGFSRFDFAAGDTDYKQHWSDNTVALFESIKAKTVKGSIWASVTLASASLKRTVKGSPWLFSAAQKARKTIFKKRI